MPRGKTKSTDPVLPPAAAVTNPNMTTTATDQNSPRLDTVSTPQDQPGQILNVDGSLPAADPQPDSAAPPALGPPILSSPETSPPQLAPQQLAEAAPQSQLRNEASESLSPNVVSTAAVPASAEAHGRPQTQTRYSGSAPNSPSGSSAVWKKNQGEPLLTVKLTAVTCQMTRSLPATPSGHLAR